VAGGARFGFRFSKGAGLESSYRKREVGREPAAIQVFQAELIGINGRALEKLVPEEGVEPIQSKKLRKILSLLPLPVRATLGNLAADGTFTANKAVIDFESKGLQPITSSTQALKPGSNDKHINSYSLVNSSVLSWVVLNLSHPRWIGRQQSTRSLPRCT
jgi:hypothetical protein